MEEYPNILATNLMKEVKMPIKKKSYLKIYVPDRTVIV